jgi:hypothetical protein
MEGVVVMRSVKWRSCFIPRRINSDMLSTTGLIQAKRKEMIRKFDRLMEPVVR